MTEATRLQLRLSEIRQRLNELAGVEDLTDEHRTEIDALTVEYRDTETKRRALIVAGDEGGDGNAGDVLPADSDPETRELVRLRGRVRVGRYIAAAMEMRAVDGAEGEYNEALKLGRERFPLRLLAPEIRATTDADAAASQRRWLDRLFSDTAAMRLGITFEPVEPGLAAFPVTKTGPAAAQRGRNEAAADGAWTVGVTELKPTRNTVRATFTAEDAARLPGLEDALVRDLRMALVEGVDRAIFIGDAGANEDTADITGLTTAPGVVEKTLGQNAKTMTADTLAAFIELVDGKHATNAEDLRIVAAVGANVLWHSTIANSDAEKTLAQFLMASGIEWGVRGDIEAATAAGDFGAFIGRGRGIEGAGVAAIWDSGMLIRDPYSDAASGGVALTMSHLWAFGLPRASNFARLKFVA